MSHQIECFLDVKLRNMFRKEEKQSRGLVLLDTKCILYNYKFYFDTNDTHQLSLIIYLITN